MIKASNKTRDSILAVVLITLLLFSSCTAKRVELPDYSNVDIRQVIAEKSDIKSVSLTFHVEFERGDNSAMTGDAALELTDKDMDLRIYSLGFLAAELKEEGGVVKSTPHMSRNRSIILVDGLRNSILWWLIKGYELEDRDGTYYLKNSWQKISVDKKTHLPKNQTIELEDGRELKISYEEPANIEGFWYQSRMKIELGKNVVKIQIKSISLNRHPTQGQLQQHL